MLGSDRPIASLIILVSSAPDAPTRVPATTRITLSSTKPSAATARPVKLLSNEISTGVSAPPTGKHDPSPQDQRHHSQQEDRHQMGRDHDRHARGRPRPAR